MSGTLEKYDHLYCNSLYTPLFVLFITISFSLLHIYLFIILCIYLYIIAILIYTPCIFVYIDRYTQITLLEYYYIFPFYTIFGFTMPHFLS